MCRTSFEELYIPDINLELQEEIKTNSPEEFKEMNEHLKKEGLWRGNLKSFKFFFGNHHRNLSVEEAGEDAHNTHEWAAFVDCSSKSEIKKFISKVEFKLHPTFHPLPPFMIKRWGWGVFEIKIVIHWKKWLAKP
eukprot:CAMPEP_0168349930 /NCGR_PEP_ID=MMETSP0213-20121227/20773_1 /TAXON_ID=151035 /ORGANISM="Euplotes harpa, Strain FSP1.4" /LENGTH=134 /DNA_ID=CAMNT_0008360093 /DNA_START=156 /DNA_END=556 /DNA_ORIENTATION=+